MRRWRGRRVAWARRRKLREIADFFRVGGGDAWMNGSQFAGKSLSAFFRFCVLMAVFGGRGTGGGRLWRGRKLGCLTHSKRSASAAPPAKPSLAGDPASPEGKGAAEGGVGIRRAGKWRARGGCIGISFADGQWGGGRGSGGGGAISHICSNSSIARRCRERKGEPHPQHAPTRGGPHLPREGRGRGALRGCQEVRASGEVRASSGPAQVCGVRALGTGELLVGAALVDVVVAAGEGFGFVLDLGGDAADLFERGEGAVGS